MTVYQLIQKLREYNGDSTVKFLPGLMIDLDDTNSDIDAVILKDNIVRLA